jgi:hypothetical protein
MSAPAPSADVDDGVFAEFQELERFLSPFAVVRVNAFMHNYSDPNDARNAKRNGYAGLVYRLDDAALATKLDEAVAAGIAVARRWQTCIAVDELHRVVVTLKHPMPKACIALAARLVSSGTPVEYGASIEMERAYFWTLCHVLVRSADGLALLDAFDDERVARWLVAQARWIVQPNVAVDDVEVRVARRMLFNVYTDYVACRDKAFGARLATETLVDDAGRQQDALRAFALRRQLGLVSADGSLVMPGDPPSLRALWTEFRHRFVRAQDDAITITPGEREQKEAFAFERALRQECGHRERSFGKSEQASDD